MTTHSHAAGLTGLAELATDLAVDGRRAILGVAGAPGAGKTTFVEALIAEVARIHGPSWVAHLPMDGFHLADTQLQRLDAVSRKGAADTFDGYGYTHTLRRIRAHTDEDIYVPGFERALEQPIAAALLIPHSARLIVTEGNYLLLDQQPWTRARAELNQVWYVATDHDVRINRLIDRHIRFGKTLAAAAEWATTSDEKNAELVAATSRLADRVIINAPHGWLTK